MTFCSWFPDYGHKWQLSPSTVRQDVLTGMFVDADPLSTEGYPDPEDIPFAEVFITTKAQALVTGNIRHFLPLAKKGLAVYSPSQFIEVFSESII
jgi:predicted nucleic acid-binding protein